MRKSELKNGMMVETRGGDLYLVVGDFMTRRDGYVVLSSYDDDMLNVNHNDFDIMKVYEYKNRLLDNNAMSISALFDKTCLTLLWERKEYKRSCLIDD